MPLSSPSRIRRVSSGAPGVSPCTQMRVDAKGSVAPVGGRHDAVADHAHRAGDDRVGIVDDRAGAVRGAQRAVGLVGAIGEPLRRDAEAGGLAAREQRGVRQAEQDERRSNGAIARAMASASARSRAAML